MAFQPRSWELGYVHEFLFFTCTCRSSLPLSCVHVNLTSVVGVYTHNYGQKCSFTNCIIDVYVRIIIQLVTLGYTLVGIRHHCWFQALKPCIIYLALILWIRLCTEISVDRLDA